MAVSRIKCNERGERLVRRMVIKDTSWSPIQAAPDKFYTLWCEFIELRSF